MKDKKCSLNQEFTFMQSTSINWDVLVGKIGVLHHFKLLL